MYYVYVLKSHKDDKFYIGSTNNLERRTSEHNNGFVKSTKHRRPLTLVYHEETASQVEARRREYIIKKMKGGVQFKMLINSRE